jgi:hypothetical protein
VSPGVGVVTFCTGEFSTSLSGAASFIAEPTFSADSSAAALFSAPPTAAAEPGCAAVEFTGVDTADEEDAPMAAALIAMVVAVGDRAPVLEAAAALFLGLSMDSSCDALACGDGGAAGFSFFIEILKVINDANSQMETFIACTIVRILCASALPVD